MTKRSSKTGNTARRRFLRQIGFLAGASVVGERSAAHAASLIQTPPLTDEQICRRKFDIAIRESLSDRPMSEIMVAIGGSFLGTPYKAQTLEAAGPEHLVVNLRALDCVTFVENTLALARCVKLGTYRFEDYLEQLRLIRYRDGRIDGYPSRLHYFSDWIHHNEERGIVRDVTRDSGGVPYTKTIDFMSTHRSSYKQLSDDDSLEKIIAIENRLNKGRRSYLPAEALGESPGVLQAGDIIGITTKVKGLDIAHTGMAAIGNGVVRYLHAPLSGGSVQLSEQSLQEYLLANKSHTGIMIARPLEPA